MPVKAILRTAFVPRIFCTHLKGFATLLTPGSIPDMDLLQKAAVQAALLKPYVSEILRHPDPFDLEKLVSIEDMFKARVHYGHKVGTLNQKMKWALFGERLGVCIFDLSITKQYLLRALNFIAHVAHRGGIILFVSSDRNNMFMIENMAQSVGEYAHVRKWRAGTLTDLKHLAKYPVRLPDTIVLLSTLTSVLETHPAVVEAAQMSVPTVGIVDSNSDPSYLTYLVPGNDDSRASVQYFMNLFVKAITSGKNASFADPKARSEDTSKKVIDQKISSTIGT